jgi:hypothetical protein
VLCLAVAVCCTSCFSSTQPQVEYTGQVVRAHDSEVGQPSYIDVFYTLEHAVPVEGARVQFLSEDGSVVHAETTTDARGRYRAVVPTRRGKVLLRVDKEGYDTAEMDTYPGLSSRYTDALVTLVPLPKA